MARVFVCDRREFPDPDPKLPVDEVRRQLAEFLPELVNADVARGEAGRGHPLRLHPADRHQGRRRRPPPARGRPRAPARRLASPRRSWRPCAGAGEAPARLRAGRRAARRVGRARRDAAAGRAPEITLAVAEAEAYARATGLATAALRRLPPR